MGLCLLMAPATRGQKAPFGSQCGPELSQEWGVRGGWRECLSEGGSISQDPRQPGVPRPSRPVQALGSKCNRMWGPRSVQFSSRR